MRLIKMIGLAAVAAIAATAFVGASSAMALENTQLCWAHEEPCAEANKVGKFTMLAGTTVLKTSVTTVLCLHSKAEAEALELGNPQLVHVLSLEFSECGRNAEHNDCNVTVEALPLFKVLKKELNLGTATVENAKVRVKCGFLVNCAYSKTEKPFSVEGAEHTEGAGNGMFTANELEVAAGEGFACPETANWTALYEPLKPMSLVS